MLADDLVDNITTELNETQQHDSLVEKARQTVKNDPNYENEYRTAKSELQQDINQMNELQKQFNPTNK
ncbi:hypothetical protein [Secundilactobacillus silagei]|nr:hypothetical protein [Secundilactobacillus silagei]